MGKSNPETDMQDIENKAILVPIREAEKVRSEILENENLDRNRKIRTTTDDSGNRFLEIPIISDVQGYRTFEQDCPEPYHRWQSLKDRLKDKISETELAQLPSGWQMLGDIIVVSIPPQLAEHRKLIADTLLEMYPKCDSVLQDFGIEGQFRQPKRQLIAGSRTRTIHKENRCKFKLDATRIMFSKGNLHEKRLMSNVAGGETVIDMFAGIGYFTIPIAVHSCPERLIAIEMNPESYGYLCENIELNHVEDIVAPINGDCAKVTPISVADRVIMGYVGTTHHYLEHGIKAIKKEGGILHYHETTPEELIFKRPIARVEEAARKLGRQAIINDCRHIKKYSPGVWHVVVDAQII